LALQKSQYFFILVFSSGLGAVAALLLCSAGSALASATSGIFATKSPSAGVWSYAPIVISGVLAIYGTIIAVIIQHQMSLSSSDNPLTMDEGYKLLTSGLSVGVACLCSGMGINKFIDMHMTQHSYSVTTNDEQERAPLLGGSGNNGIGGKNELPVTWTLVFTMCFLEAIGLYGLIVALFIAG